MDNLKEQNNIRGSYGYRLSDASQKRVPGGRRRSEVHQIFKRIDSDECNSSTVADIIYVVAIDSDNDVHVEP